MLRSWQERTTDQVIQEIDTEKLREAVGSPVVCLWPKADIPFCSAHVRFRGGKADILSLQTALGIIPRYNYLAAYVRQ